jgi:hypothetical protein
VTVEPSAAHRSSHRSLLRQPRPGGGSVDAIVVPASRPAAYLLPAMEVASALGCRFVALCSGRVDLDEAAALAHGVLDLSWTLVEVGPDSAADLLRFGTSEIREAAESRVGDLSRKRNIGLLLAHLAGWRGILFLDDDIRDLSPRAVRAAAAVLERGRAVGMIATDFPDNSVVCHASRLSGRPQDVFVSGSALAVDTTAIDSFFPETYNEDWLFLYDLIRSRRVSAAGIVRQAPYRPFADPSRAAREEFGDVLAEGLMSLLHDRADVEQALEIEYWRQAIAERHRLFDEITAGLAGNCRQDPTEALRAIDAARGTLGLINGDVLAMFVRRWREDVKEWRKALLELEAPGTLSAALDLLELDYYDNGPAPVISLRPVPKAVDPALVSGPVAVSAPVLAVSGSRG